MDEANVETHGFEPSFTKKNAHPACWPEWHDAIVDRGVRMVYSTAELDGPPPWALLFFWILMISACT